MLQFTGKMNYSEDSVYKLTEMQHRTFQSGTRLATFAFAVVLLLIGFSLGISSAFGICALFVGCIFITSINARSRNTAKTLISQLNGNYPHMVYEFTDSGFSSTEESERTRYSSVLRLIDDGSYLYIYVTEAKAYMIEKSSVVSVGNKNDFLDFIAEKTGLSWERPTTIMNMNIRSLRNKK